MPKKLLEKDYKHMYFAQTKMEEKFMFKPKFIYYEKEILKYPLGQELMGKYKDIKKIEIKNHNNIEEMRNKQNSEFINMKQNLIIGVRKTHKFVENHKTSDYLVPYTSSRMHSCLYVLLSSL